MRRLMTAVGIAGLVLLAVLGLVWLLQRQLIYFPSTDLPALARLEAGGEEVSFSTADGFTLHGWLFAAEGDTRKATVIVFNGNAGNRAGRLPLAKALTGRGYEVLLFDYRGYGSNEGKPTETGLLMDGEAAVAFLDERGDHEPLVYFGESLGAAVSIGVALRRPPDVLVLRSPFASLDDMAAAHYPWLPGSLLLRDRFPSDERIGHIVSPLLVVAGSSDAIVPLEQSRALFDAAADPKRLVVIDGAGHNDFEMLAGEELIEYVDRFVGEWSEPAGH